MISVFDIFKVGIGPSSSHTVGPMKAGKQFVDELCERRLLDKAEHIHVDVYGSLSMTGIGHGTDTAIMMGLAGYLPHDVDIDLIPRFVQNVKDSGVLPIDQGSRSVRFDYAQDMQFHDTFLPLHENGMSITAFSDGLVLYRQTYYSIGGGFIVDEAHFGEQPPEAADIPFPYQYADDILNICRSRNISLAELALANETAVLGSEAEVHCRLQSIWQTMHDCIERGLVTEGILPGPLKVTRRAPLLKKRLEAATAGNDDDPMQVVDWINMYALAVNEENAAGGRVVTAPTNGACGIVPAVLMYYRKYLGELMPDIISRYLLTAGLIGSLYKMNASISGAEVGCQGEVGVACSMAAGALAAVRGGTPEQVCTAAEIAMEHNLGLTCDPVGGQVQVPCIERNAIGAVKAINAARMAMTREGQTHVSLDKVIETMYETGKDMNAKYRETSKGGLAVRIVCQ
ncbi:L-serine ammonia-lyase [Neisseria sp. ZJ106]|uniref:L-serine dehydratase n=1 Tax=Neisseria lisongii TaxID=2912188 RepID=A0ABY7RLU5_9NEIS|nr:L-serine ammonia-lyase [Neisseria lisongii]MCF7521456.1 L-serine ammonia-lyase [Neisseria lisongii]WCL72293.1 L-serine ammonia-lyase [Neisseria lisongii]